MKNCYRGALILLILSVILFLPGMGSAALKIAAEPGTDPRHLEMVQKTVNAFNEILQQDMGVTLDRDVTIFISPTRESYRQVLQREIGQRPDEAERNAKVTGGFSRGKSNAVVINLDPANGGSVEFRAYNTTAHELFHQVQYQLAKENMGKSYYWLKEGAADLIGATVAERIGYQSLDKWKLDQVNVLRKAEKHVSPQDILITNLDKWTTFIEQKQYPYQMSDLMIFYLLKQTGGNGYRTIADYYRLLGQGVENQTAFERAFGVAPNNIIGGFRVWFAEISAQPANIEIVSGPEVSADLVSDFNRGADITRQFFGENWGKDIASSMRFVLAKGKPAFAAAMAKEFGISASEAEERAKHSAWWYSGSTTVFDLGAMPTKQQRIFSISNSLVKRFQQEAASKKDLEQLFWLVSGSADAVSALLVERSGLSTVGQYRAGWLTFLSKAGALPMLTELGNQQQWNDAKARYGATGVSRIAGLAGLYLMDKYGVVSFIAWCHAVKETGNAETAFQKVYGLTATQFSEEFSGYLRAKVKDAS